MMAENFTNLADDINLSEPQDTSKEIHAKIHHNQILKTKDKEKDFESNEREQLT